MFVAVRLYFKLITCFYKFQKLRLNWNLGGGLGIFKGIVVQYVNKVM